MSNRLEKQYQESTKLKNPHRGSRQYRIRILSQPSQNTRTGTLGTPPMHLQSTETLQPRTSRAMTNDPNRPTKPYPQCTIRPSQQTSTNGQWTHQSPSRNRELLSMSPEVRSQYKDSTTTRRMPYNNGNTAQNYLKMETGVADKQPTYAAEQSSFTFENTTNRALSEEALILPDPIEEYYNTLRHGEQPDLNQLIVAVESGAVRTILAFIDNKEQKECILDPGCQVVAMSEATCHQLGLAYNPSIILNMVSANGNINQSLGLARNVPFQVGSITFYLQVHIIESPAYDVLLGRPFDILTESIVRNFNNQDQTITISDPNTGRGVTVPTLNRNTKSKHCTHQKEEDF